MYNVMLSIAGTLAVLMVMFFVLYYVVDFFGLDYSFKSFFANASAICLIILIFDIILSVAFLFIVKLWESLV